MNKLIIAANGHPRTNNDLLHLQDAIIEASKALSYLCGENGSTLILIGGLYPTVYSQGYNVSDAFFYYNNELFYFGGATDFQDYSHFRISSTFAANNPYMGKNIHNIRVLIPILAGNNIAGDIPITYTDAVKAIAKKGIGLWSSINAAGSAFYPQFATGIIHAVGHTVQYRLNANGEFELRGKADVGGYTGSSLGGYSLINFGAGPLTTNYPQHGCVAAFLNGGNNGTPCTYEATNSGLLIRHASTYSLQANDTVWLGSVRFYKAIS
jgi:hypothetical protein